MTEALVTLTAGIAIALGVVGTLVPILPGIALVWVAQLMYGVFAGFGFVGWAAMAASTLLAGLAIFQGVRIPQRSAAVEGVSAAGQVLGALLAIAGFFVVPIIGAPIGFALGVWIHRLRMTGDARRAWTSTARTIRALLRASFVQFTCAVGMALVWGLWVVMGRGTSGG